MKKFVLPILVLSFFQAQFGFCAEDAEHSDLHDPSRDALENSLKGPLAPSPEEELPVSPQDLKNKNLGKEMEKVYQNSDNLKLTGEAKSAGIFSNATKIESSPLSRYKGAKLTFYKVTVKNQSNQPMLILGSQSSLNLNAIRKKEDLSNSVDASTLEEHDNNLLTPGKKAAIGLVGLGSAGFFGPLTYEYLTPSEHRKRDLGIALGRDRGRHEVEGERLGLRLIMPGGDTTGWISFKKSSELDAATKIYVPVMYPPYKVVKEVLSIPMAKSAIESKLNQIGETPKKDK